MAGLNEMAIGIASVLSTASEPEPLPVQFRGQTLEDAAYLIRAIHRECADAGVFLHHVMVDRVLFDWFTQSGVKPLVCTLLSGAEPGEALFYRRSKH